MEEYRLTNKVSDARLAEFQGLVERLALSWAAEREIADWFLDVYADWQEEQVEIRKEDVEELSNTIKEVFNEVHEDEDEIYEAVVKAMDEFKKGLKP